jgi:hypothetical protein
MDPGVAAVAQLEGVAAAIVYDGRVDDLELALLITWMRDHSHVDVEPVTSVRKQINKIIRDRKVTDGERRRLLELLLDVTPIPPAVDVFDGIEAPAIEVRGRVFVLARSTLAPRNVDLLCTQLTTRGGAILPHVNEADYVVMGAHGPKVPGLLAAEVERAIARRRECGEPLIIEEYQLSLRLMAP